MRLRLRARQHPREDELVLFFYGEAGADRSAAIRGHMDTCEACRNALGNLQRTLAAVGGHAVPDRDAEYGADVWARLQPKLGAAANTIPRAQPASWSWLAPRRLAFAGGIALLVVAAFVAGRLSSSRAPGQATPGRGSVAQSRGAHPSPQQANGSVQVRDRVLLVAVSDHLERSQMVLVELMNTSEAKTIDISGTQEWARELVPSNRLFRQVASESGQAAVADVLDDLERVLVELANSPSRLSSADFQRVRQRIESQGIVFKIRVLDSQVRQHEQSAPVGPARSVS